jgi:hypothetical protein
MGQSALHNTPKDDDIIARLKEIPIRSDCSLESRGKIEMQYGSRKKTDEYSPDERSVSFLLLLGILRFLGGLVFLVCIFLKEVMLGVSRPFFVTFDDFKFTPFTVLRPILCKESATHSNLFSHRIQDVLPFGIPCCNTRAYSLGDTDPHSS